MGGLGFAGGLGLPLVLQMLMKQQNGGQGAAGMAGKGPAFGAGLKDAIMGQRPSNLSMQDQMTLGMPANDRGRGLMGLMGAAKPPMSPMDQMTLGGAPGGGAMK